MKDADNSMEKLQITEVGEDKPYSKRLLHIMNLIQAINFAKGTLKRIRKSR